MKHSRSILKLIGGVAFITISTLSQAALEPALSLSEEQRMKHESTGVIGGALIGGLLGGPIGAIATAAFGGWVSDKTIAKKENELLNTALNQQGQDLIALQAQYRALEARYQVASRESQAARVRNASFSGQDRSINNNPSVTACCNDAELSLHFKTGSTSIEPLYEEKLAQFITLVNTLPEAVIGITGHADRRGDSDVNLGLSQQRVQAVEKKLNSHGLSKRALQTSAYGESRPVSQTDSLEDNFFDRRVVLKIISAGNDRLTRNDD
ncbi:MAG: sortase system peptidoglycan-associated protein [Pseudohongiellaceae bacterium]|jgi:sortase system peptidoglycan-associated protein